MRISESNMTLESSGYQKTSKVEVESLEIWDNRGSKQGSKDKGDGISISEAGASHSFFGYHFLSTERISELEEVNEVDEDELLSEEDKLKIQLIEAFMSIWLKRDFKIRGLTLHIGDDKKDGTADKLRQLKGHNGKVKDASDKANPQVSKAKGKKRNTSQQIERQGWGIRYQHYEEEAKEQRMDFSAKGKVVLEDGREIQIDYRLHMSEASYKRSMTSFKAGDALIDPIVINYKGPSTNLTKEKYEFDIDMDGTKDQISFATNGSGFLALDKNDNGQIDDGSELFGPKSNDGFSELAAYDQDGNGWIDEGDAVFNQLRIWERKEDGSSELLSLGEVGIGAIYLKDATTLFDLSDDELNMQAKMKTSSIFLREDGTAGGVHEIDLVV